MGRWSDQPDGRLDLVANDEKEGRGWMLWRLIEHNDVMADGSSFSPLFVIRLFTAPGELAGFPPGRVRHEIYDNIIESVKRCVQWMEES